jgi:hypothetical protein
MIRVNEDWVIMVDSLNYMPCKDLHRTKPLKQKDGGFVDVDEYSNPIGYYSTLSAAITGIMQYNFRKSVQFDDVDLKEALKIIESVNADMEMSLHSYDIKVGIK